MGFSYLRQSLTSLRPSNRRRYARSQAAGGWKANSDFTAMSRTGRVRGVSKKRAFRTRRRRSDRWF